MSTAVSAPHWIEKCRICWAVFSISGVQKVTGNLGRKRNWYVCRGWFKGRRPRTLRHPPIPSPPGHMTQDLGSVVLWFYANLYNVILWENKCLLCKHRQTHNRDKPTQSQAYKKRQKGTCIKNSCYFKKNVLHETAQRPAAGLHQGS